MIAIMVLFTFLTMPVTPTAAVAVARSLDIYTSIHTFANGSCHESNPALMRADGSYRAGKAVAVTAGYVVATYAANLLARKLGKPWLVKLTAGASYGVASVGAWQAVRTVRQCQW